MAGARLVENAEELAARARNVPFAQVLKGFRVDHAIPQRLAGVEIGKSSSYLGTQLAEQFEEPFVLMSAGLGDPVP